MVSFCLFSHAEGNLVEPLALVASANLSERKDHRIIELLCKLLPDDLFHAMAINGCNLLILGASAAPKGTLEHP
jgi:hypothetical protein